MTLNNRQAGLEKYWISNMRVVAVLIPIWAAVSLGCGVLFADTLNKYNLPGTGYPLGFWFAQQGSIIVFVILILVYCLWMNRLDNKHHREREAQKKNGSPT
jgi:putative solute:sodium symporter small subunit